MFGSPRRARARNGRDLRGPGRGERLPRFIPARCAGRTSAMTRCLDCGSERESDQCASCGLTSAAAEVMLRRRLVRPTAWFLLGAVVFLPVSQLYPPLELDAIFIFA